EGAVFGLRAGPEARRSLSTTPDDCPSPRHAVRRRTLGGARLAAVRWNRARGSTPYPYPDAFGIVPGHRHDERARSGRYLSERCWIDAGSLLAIRAVRLVARGSESWSGC